MPDEKTEYRIVNGRDGGMLGHVVSIAIGVSVWTQTRVVVSAVSEGSAEEIVRELNMLNKRWNDDA